MKKIVPILGLSLLMVACGNQGDTANTSNTAGTNTPNNTIETNTNNNMDPAMNNNQATDQEPVEGAKARKVEGEITNASLAQAFLEEFPQGQVTEVSYDKDDDGGKELYTVEGIELDKEVEIKVDASNGEVRVEKVDDDTDDGDDKNEVIDLAAVKEFKEAIEAAKKESGAQELESFTLSMEDGKEVYEVEFKDGEDKDVDLDAKTLEVIEIG